MITFANVMGGDWALGGTNNILGDGEGGARDEGRRAGGVGRLTNKKH